MRWSRKEHKRRGKKLLFAPFAVLGAVGAAFGFKRLRGRGKEAESG